MTTIPPAYAAKLRRLQELLPGAKLLDPCPDPAGDSNGHRLHSRCHGTGAVVPPLEVLLGRLVRAAQAQFGAIWLYRHRDWLLMADPEDALVDAMLAALGEKV